MISRRGSSYYALPEKYWKGSKQKDGKMDVTISIAIPPEFEKKATKWIDKQHEEISKKFRKAVEKWIEAEE